LDEEGVNYSLALCDNITVLKALYNSDTRFANFKHLFSERKKVLNAAV